MGFNQSKCHIRTKAATRFWVFPSLPLPALFHSPGPFSQCHRVVAPQSSFSSCLYGQCATKGDTLTLCRSLQAYASLCARAGQALTWRNGTFCRE